ncbi:uncharacterized protein [Cherax quadricarinatus]
MGNKGSRGLRGEASSPTNDEYQNYTSKQGFNDNREITDQGSEAATMAEEDEQMMIEKPVFSEAWMNRCYNDLVSPNPACAKVMDKVNRALAKQVSRFQGTEFMQQALFSLLGPQFTAQYFPYTKYNVQKLDSLSVAQKKKYLSEAREFLNQSLTRAITGCGYPEDVGTYKNNDELGVFLQEVRTSFSEALRRHTAVVIFNEEAEKIRQKQGTKKGYYYSDDDDNEDDAELEKVKKKALKTEAGIKASDVAGKSFLALVNYDSAKKAGFVKRLRERHLSLTASLRQFFWWEHLMEREGSQLRVNPDQDAKVVAKERFEATLAKEMTNQNVERAVRSNSWKEIDKGVMEVYDSTSPLRSINDEQHMIHSARALNLHTIISKSFSKINVYWLLPLQLVFTKKPDENDDSHMVELALLLQLVLEHCQPPQQVVFEIAETATRVVKKNDPQYYDHLTRALSTQVSRIKLKDFPPEVLQAGMKASTKLYEDLEVRGTDNMKQQHLELFTTPAIFVRKWISQGFVGVVSVTAVLWLWDQLFLDGWKKTTLTNMALAILALIKPWMTKANMYSGARKVLLDEPGKLYLSDLRKALAHLESGGTYKDIPKNKNFIGTKVANTTTQVQKWQDKEEQPPVSSLQRGPDVVLPYVPDPLFNIDLQLDSDDDDDVYQSAPEPYPDDMDPTPVIPLAAAQPPVTPPPPLTPSPPPPEDTAWVPYDKSTAASLPQPTRTSDPFDFYIDCIRFLPDNVSHCKVTGEIVNMYTSKEKRDSDIVAFPQFDSSSYCPSFRFKIRLNNERIVLNPKMIIMLRVYGYQSHRQNVGIVGSCLLQVFNTSKTPPVLRVGGVQRRLRQGLPIPPQGMEKLHVADMDDKDPIPGVSICVRLLPASKETVEAPAYESGYYKSDECQPTGSERQLFRHYMQKDDFTSSTVKENVKEAQAAAGVAESKTTNHLQRYMEETLDWRTQQKKTNLPPPDLDFIHYVHYDINVGLKAMVLGAFNLPEYMEGLYCHAYCQVLPGDEADDLPSTPEGYGHDQHFITMNPDFLSYQRSPHWLDDPVTLHPHYDERSILLVQMFGFSPKYRPGDGTSPGTVTTSDKQPLIFDYNKPLAWTCTQIFDKDAVKNGLHWLPLFSGHPDALLLSMLNELPPAHQVIAKNKSSLKPIDGASIEIKTCDGHLNILDIKECQLEKMMDAVGQRSQCSAGLIKTFPRTVDEFYKKSMNKSRGNKDQEREVFEQAANAVFFNAMNEALEEAGYTALPTDS